MTQSNIGKNARSPALTKTAKRYAIQEKVELVKAASGKERKTEEKQKTIYDLLDEVAETMCDKYCKYPESYEGTYDEMLEEICANCPMCKVL